MKVKTVLVFAISAAFFTLAATYRFHDSAHAMGMIRKGGGMARHPALLDKDRETYMLIATAGVMAPYRGNARVVLEGDPNLVATFYNSEVPVDLGVYRHPRFRDNTYYDLRPKDRIALWVKIRRSQGAAHQQVVDASVRPTGRGAEPPCTQCEADGKASVAVPSEIKASAGPSADPAGKSHDTAKTGEQGGMWKGRRQDETTAPGSGRQGKSAGAFPAKGTVVAFYDVATNEPLLRIPIRFTGGTGGREDDH